MHKLAQIALPVVLAAVAVSACAVAGTAPASDTSAPTEWVVSSQVSPIGDGGAGLSVVCVTGHPTAAYRDVYISKGEPSQVGDSCPAGTVLDSASCHPDGTAFDIHPDAPIDQTEAGLACSTGF